MAVFVNVRALETIRIARRMENDSEFAEAMEAEDPTATFHIEAPAIEKIKRTGRTSQPTLRLMAKVLAVPEEFIISHLVPWVVIEELRSRKGRAAVDAPQDLELMFDAENLDAYVAAYKSRRSSLGSSEYSPSGLLGFNSNETQDSDGLFGWFEVIHRASSIGRPWLSFELMKVQEGNLQTFCMIYDRPVIKGVRRDYHTHAGQVNLVGGNFSYFTLLNKTHGKSYSVLAVRNPHHITTNLVRYGVRLHIAGGALEDDPDPTVNLDHPVAVKCAIRHLGLTASEAVSSTIIDTGPALELILKSGARGAFERTPEQQAEAVLFATVGGYLDPSDPDRPVRMPDLLRQIHTRINVEPLRAR